MTQAMLDLTDSAVLTTPQWRLSRIELVNWGTFSNHHVINLGKRAHLLTGGSGSGKSTLLDAIAAVLMPRGQVRFNAAAADQSGRFDRTLVTYVRGAWRRQENDQTGEVASDYLRTKATWSGVLLSYENGGQAVPLNLIKLYHAKRGAARSAEISELGVILNRQVSLMDFQPFAKDGLDTRGIKRQWPDLLKATDQHSTFAARFQRAMGITSEGAMALLHRTQSAKSLGSLDSLFQNFTLDRPATFDIAAKAAEQFDELRQAHTRVVQARQQVEHLTPLRSMQTTAGAATETVAKTQRLLAVNDAVRDAEKARLAQTALEQAGGRLRVTRSELTAAQQRQAQAEDRHSAACLAVQEQGGLALARLEASIGADELTLQRTQRDYDAIKAQLGEVGLPVPSSDQDYEQLLATQMDQAAVGQEDAATLGQLRDISVRLMDLQQQQRTLEVEFTAANSCRSNLPAALLQARQMVCLETGLPAKALPFAGELMQVRPAHQEWTGAIERVLRPLATTMLVPQRHRAEVTQAVSDHFLATRLVMEIVGQETSVIASPQTPASLVRRLELAEGPFKDWLAGRLCQAYDYQCVQDLSQYAAATTAVTVNGLVKRGKLRQEKDDRSRVDDRSRWVLGMDNTAKLDRLTGQLDTLRHQIADLTKAYTAADHARDLRRGRQSALAKLASFSWQELDVAAAQSRLALTKRALGELRAASSNLRRAEKTRDDTAKQLASAKQASEKAIRAVSKAELEVDRFTKALAELAQQSVQVDHSAAERTELLDLYQATKQQRALSYESIDRCAAFVAKTLNTQRDAAQQQLFDASNAIDRLTRAYLTQWPEAQTSLQAGASDTAGFLELLDGLVADRLPEFEDKFFDLLGSQAQRNVGVLSQVIRRAPRQIRERIREINQSLSGSLFEADRYLRIQVKDARPTVATEFLSILGTIADDSLREVKDRDKAEARFQAMRQIMDRLHPNNSDPADKRWRELCLDTRRHVRFVGEEVDTSGVVVNVHDTSSGLSGGQQQKLAIFCLAAALRYQLAGEAGSVPTYATVVMDEAFDRADTDFTRMAMDVFVAFGFHMVLATPLKALGALEDYLDGIGLVTCEDSKASRVKTVDIAAMAEVGPDQEVAAVSA